VTTARAAKATDGTPCAHVATTGNVCKEVIHTDKCEHLIRLGGAQY